MPVQIINEKSQPAVLSKPLQHYYQLFIGEMMTKKRGKNDIRFVLPKIYFPEIIIYPFTRHLGVFLFCEGDTSRVQINAYKANRGIIFFTILVNSKKIIASATANLTNSKSLSIVH